MASLRPLLRLTVPLLLVAAATVSAAATQRPVASHALDLELRPPRPAAPGSHRGFPSRVTLFEPEAPRARERLKRVLRRLARPSSPADEPRVEFSSRSVTVDLLGGITKVGEYYTRIYIGGQPVRVQIDTGSSTLALPVAECDRCLPTDQRYNPRLSTSKHKRWIKCTNPLCRPDVCALHKCGRCSAHGACCAEENARACAFRLKYGDGSGARGGLMVDEMRWGNSPNVSAPVIFGAILHDSPDFERPLVDGILGMAYRALACNPTCVEPPLQQMVKAGVVSDSFSICITPGGGKLVLGDFDDRLAKEKLTYVPLALSDPPMFYTVNMTNVIKIGGRDVSIPNMRAGIVDSGTTLLVLAETTFRLILQQLTQFHCDVPGLCHTAKPWFLPTACVRLDDATLAKLPTLKFHLGTGADKFVLELRPQDYMLTMSDPRRKGFRCVGIMISKTMGAGTDVIFGNTVMMRYVSHYDRAHKRVGFAQAAPNCGGQPDCASYSQCAECATAPGCRWNFADAVCAGGSGMSSLAAGLVPYPECSGAHCFCKLGAVNGIVFGLGAGAGGALVVVAVAALIVVLHSKRSAAAAAGGPGLPRLGRGRGRGDAQQWLEVDRDDAADAIGSDHDEHDYIPAEKQ